MGPWWSLQNEIRESWGWYDSITTKDIKPAVPDKDDFGVPSDYALNGEQEDFAETFLVAVYVFLHGDDSFHNDADPLWDEIYGSNGIFIPDAAIVAA